MTSVELRQPSGGSGPKTALTTVNSLGFDRAPTDCRVVAAMSGGVDSSVVAAVLKEQGYDVIGITLQLYDHGAAVQKKGACCAGQDIHDARRVAEALEIPHYVLDYEERFRASVMDDFADSYLKGETPVPCIRCNERVKFRDLLELARELDADCLATGHYVQRIYGSKGPELHRAVDWDRDQSYFLFSTTPEQLDYLRFPLGGLSKSDTRAIAKRLGLRTADKADSQDICFVPNGHYADVIEKLRPGASEPGDLVHVDGRVLGRHHGIINFTIGQRRGLGVAYGDPLFVVAIDAASRRVVVGPRDSLLVKKISLRDVNWLGDGSLDENLTAQRSVCVKVRSTRPPIEARLIRGENGAVGVELAGSEEGVARGQACVFYDVADNGSRVLGGGWIQSISPVSPVDSI